MSDVVALDARRLRWLLVWVGGFVAMSLIANVMSVRIVRVAGFSIDAGTLTYPLTFTLRDLIHKAGGRSAARTTIVVTAVLNVVLALGLWAASALPADPAVGPQTEFGAVLVGTWRIVAASILAQVLSELADTEVYAAWVRRFGAARQWGRVLSSNAVAVPIDSVVFVVVAFAGTTGMDASTIWSIVVANVVVKGATSLVSAPLIYAVRGPDADRIGPSADPEGDQELRPALGLRP